MDVVTLGAALNGSKKYTDQVAQSLMGGVHYRGSVSYYTDLPNDASEGDSYTVKYAGTSGSIADGTEYTWGYDTDSQDYAWISFSKDAYSKAETDTLLGGKQATIDSSHKLSSDLVDDSSSINKFATAAQLTQISTNETNISTEQGKTVGMTAGGSNYITVGGIRVYVSSTAPTGDIPDGSIWIGG